jgi:hypothetical protein
MSGLTEHTLLIHLEQGTVATAISAAKELALALFRMFNVIEEGAIPSTDETAADIQDCARYAIECTLLITPLTFLVRLLEFTAHPVLVFGCQGRDEAHSDCDGHVSRIAHRSVF